MIDAANPKDYDVEANGYIHNYAEHFARFEAIADKAVSEAPPTVKADLTTLVAQIRDVEPGLAAVNYEVERADLSTQNKVAHLAGGSSDPTGHSLLIPINRYINANLRCAMEAAGASRSPGLSGS